MSRRGPEVAALVDRSRTERIRAVALGIACHGAFIDAGLGLQTGPVLTTDRLLLASAWTLYCLIGLLYKEHPALRRDPDGYGRYKKLVPYWLPRLSRRRLES